VSDDLRRRKREAEVDVIRALHRHAPLLAELAEASIIFVAATDRDAPEAYGAGGTGGYPAYLKQVTKALEKAQRELREGADG
jgi:hypothetical protein